MSKQIPRVNTPEDLQKMKNHPTVLSVGDLKRCIENLPDDTLVFAERIEDIYFEKYQWGVLLHEDSEFMRISTQLKNRNEPPLGDDMKAQYINASSCYEENGILFIRHHY